tara:strand:+ start:319 stop:531 length:213 start_codon:yes stop_codon:yes gene_type:complete
MDELLKKLEEIVVRQNKTIKAQMQVIKETQERLEGLNLDTLYQQYLVNKTMIENKSIKKIKRKKIIFNNY